MLLNVERVDVQVNSFVRWQTDLVDLSEEEWKEAMEVLPKVSISLSQQLTQLFIIHRTHYTPQKLYAWGKYTSPLCPRCSVSNGSLIHMLWRCPKLQKYWGKVFQTLNTLCCTGIACAPKIAILGIVPVGTLPIEMNKLWTRTLYLARKLILQKWIDIAPPTHK